MLCFIDFGSIYLLTAIPWRFGKLRFQNIGIGFFRFCVHKIFQGILPFSGDKLVADISSMHRFSIRHSVLLMLRRSLKYIHPALLARKSRREISWFVLICRNPLLLILIGFEDFYVLCNTIPESCCALSLRTFWLSQHLPVCQRNRDSRFFVWM